MFSALNPDELSIVLDAMEQVKKRAGEVIIKEGDDGDNLYVVDSGVLTCTKHFVSFLRYLFNHTFIERKSRAHFLKRVQPW